MLDTSLGAMDRWSLLAALCLPAGLLALVWLGSTHRIRHGSLYVAGILACLLVAILGGPALARLQRRREERWLRARPYPLDVRACLIALGEKRKATVVSVTMVFGAELTEEMRNKARDGALGLAPSAEPKWTAQGTLCLKSPVLVTSRPPTRRQSTRYSNRPAHLWFRPLAAGLPALAAIAPLVSVKVESS